MLICMLILSLNNIGSQALKVTRVQKKHRYMYANQSHLYLPVNRVGQFKLHELYGRYLFQLKIVFMT